MTFCNKGVVQADPPPPPPPVMVKDHIFTFFRDPSLNQLSEYFLPLKHPKIVEHNNNMNRFRQQNTSPKKWVFQ